MSHLIDEKQEMAVIGVQMSLVMISTAVARSLRADKLGLTFDAQSTDLVKMRMVDMRIHPEKTAEDGLCRNHEGRREADS